MAVSRLLTGTAVLGLSASCANISARAAENTSYTYDAQGRLIAAQSSGSVNNNQAQSFCYDFAGNRTVFTSSAAGTSAICPASGPAPTPSPTPAPAPTPTPTATPSVSVADAAGTEGDTLYFVVSLSTASTATVTVSYATAVGTANGTDYTGVSGVLTFSPGQTSKSVAVTTRTDAKVESSEVFYLNLSGPSGATLGRSQAIGTIDDDGAGGGPLCGGVPC